MHRNRSRIEINKINFLIIASIFVTAIIIFRLFQLQIIKHQYFQEIATKSQHGVVELPAQRGEILIKDQHSQEEFLLATNITLDLLYADPSIIKDPIYLAKKLSPLIFDLNFAREEDDKRIEKASKNIPLEATEEEIEQMLRPLSDNELEKKFQEELEISLSQKQRPEILLATELEPEILEQIQTLNLSGIEIIEKSVYAYPSQISNRTATSEKLGPLVEIPTSKLFAILEGRNRYVVLKKKIQPNISEQIQTLIKEDELFAGLGLQEEYFRFYPEGQLAANIVGYVNHENIGQYGIESSFNTQLQGKAGQFQTKRDSIGRQITVGESVLNPAVDGDNIVLTIDRSIQMKTEEIIKEAVEKYRADSGQAIIMEPKTGNIIAMVNYPTFNPNEYGDVFELVDISFSEEEMEKNLVTSNQEDLYYYYTDAVTLSRYPVFKKNDKFYRYKNYTGPEVYHNKIISWPYEPGSVFKSIVMGIAIDDGDITPNTTYNDTGPVGVDFNPYTNEYDFEIKNSEGYKGLVSMSSVLAESLNTGMTFIAKRIGGSLFYSYLKKFGFLDRTDIEFDAESKGKIEYFEDWTESELATHAFGQGLTVTMIQLANAYSALINGGVLMQPHIIDYIKHDNDTQTHIEPHEISRVVSEESSSTMIAMLVNSVENGVANKGQVEGHFVGGKTGTSQTYKHGQALSGVGTTITSFAGFGPINNPQFIVVIKFDHPRLSEWGSETAAPTFSLIAKYLFDYYNIPPDK
ncbi:penicillin-binding protein 2 [Patescibacteria group bacterium]|nr:penicillin-binding protein 2 [Patescibacteria group bacterium]